MNKQEALALLQARLDEYRQRSYGDLEKQIGDDRHLEIAGPSSVEYQIEIQVLWEKAPGGKLLVMGSVDDGGIRAFAPLCETFVVAPLGELTEQGPPLWKHIKAVMLLPFMAMVAIPAAILCFTGLGGMALHRAAPWNGLLLGGTAALLGVGLTLIVATIRLFVQIGRGTLAPWNATQRLVVAGPYRHVRNPMISGVFCVLLAEALFFGSPPLLGWSAVFLLVTVVYIPFREEPGLERRFRDDYVRYRLHVPRWIPRVTPWRDEFR